MVADTYPAPSAEGALPRPVPDHARHKKTWAPDLIAGVLWRGVTHLGTHRKVMQLLKLPAMAEAARKNPRFGYKYLTHDYLVRGLTTDQRAACFLHHYRRMHDTLVSGTLRQTLDAFITLHEIQTEANRFSITLNLSRDFDKEGEFSLNLHVDGEVVFLLAFTIVPGEIVFSTEPEILLISRMQGMKGSYQGIQTATHALHNVAPDAVLVACLQGLAIAFGIKAIGGVSAHRQSSYTPESSQSFTRAYDDFFKSLEIPLNDGGFYLTPVPMELKPLSLVKKGHKIRTKEKRAFKLALQQACTAFFAGQMRTPPVLPAPELDPASAEESTLLASVAHD
jgi:uncharacterized protein VirK/YbjX